MNYQIRKFYSNGDNVILHRGTYEEMLKKKKEYDIPFWAGVDFVIEEEFKNTIKMGEMRPLEIGIIHSKELHPDYDGFIVMRTASTLKFEVMSLTNMQDSFCWTNDDCPLEVEIIAIDLNDYLYNYANIKNQIFNRR